MRVELLEQLLAASRRRLSSAVATNLATGAQSIFVGPEAAGEGDVSLRPEELALVRRAMTSHQGRSIDTQAGTVFVDVWSPPPRLFVVGAVHIAQLLVPLARIAGYDVTVIDPRTAFATAERFPDTTLRHEWPDEALGALSVDERTAVVTLTHDPKIDDPALHAALRSAAFYVGSLGSRRTHAKRVERLTQAGFDGGSIARIYGPVGLAIGALTPGEIAISIVAQMTAVLRGGSASPARAGA
jgi:xanthine dehydrogenase accessory factor